MTSYEYYDGVILLDKNENTAYNAPLFIKNLEVLYETKNASRFRSVSGNASFTA